MVTRHQRSPRLVAQITRAAGKTPQLCNNYQYEITHTFHVQQLDMPWSTACRPTRLPAPRRPLPQPHKTRRALILITAPPSQTSKDILHIAAAAPPLGLLFLTQRLQLSL